MEWNLSHLIQFSTNWESSKSYFVVDRMDLVKIQFHYTVRMKDQNPKFCVGSLGGKFTDNIYLDMWERKNSPGSSVRSPRVGVIECLSYTCILFLYIVLAG